MVVLVFLYVIELYVINADDMSSDGYDNSSAIAMLIKGGYHETR